MAFGITIAAAVRPATTSARIRPPAGSTVGLARGTGTASLTAGGLLLGRELLADSGELGELLLPHLRVPQIEGIEGLDHGGRDDDPREPLVVGRDDVPRRVLRRRLPDHRLVGAHVVLPEPALLGVGRRKLPILRGIVDALEEPPLLLLA